MPIMEIKWQRLTSGEKVFQIGPLVWPLQEDLGGKWVSFLLSAPGECKQLEGRAGFLSKAASHCI